MDEVLLYIYSNVAGPSRLFSDLHHGWMLLPALFSLEQTHSLHPPLGKSRFQGACCFFLRGDVMCGNCQLDDVAGTVPPPGTTHECPRSMCHHVDPNSVLL